MPPEHSANLEVEDEVDRQQEIPEIEDTSVSALEKEFEEMFEADADSLGGSDSDDSTDVSSSPSASDDGSVQTADSDGECAEPETENVSPERYRAVSKGVVREKRTNNPEVW